MDGRDTDPRSGKGFIEELEAHCAKSAGKIASIIGRYYAMDRDKRWERVKEAYDLLVNGIGRKSDNMVQAMQESYDADVTDEFIKPIVNTTCDGRIKEGDVVIFFNYRNDRAKEPDDCAHAARYARGRYAHDSRFAILLHDALRCLVQGCSYSFRQRECT